jgi:hypothetical protein
LALPSCSGLEFYEQYSSMGRWWKFAGADRLREQDDGDFKGEEDGEG